MYFSVSERNVARRFPALRTVRHFSVSHITLDNSRPTAITLPRVEYLLFFVCRRQVLNYEIITESLIFVLFLALGYSFSGHKINQNYFLIFECILVVGSVVPTFRYRCRYQFQEQCLRFNSLLTNPKPWTSHLKMTLATALKRRYNKTESTEIYWKINNIDW